MAGVVDKQPRVRLPEDRVALLDVLSTSDVRMELAHEIRR
jgi:hypothetical protein